MLTCQIETSSMAPLTATCPFSPPITVITRSELAVNSPSTFRFKFNLEPAAVGGAVLTEESFSTPSTKNLGLMLPVKVAS